MFIYTGLILGIIVLYFAFKKRSNIYIFITFGVIFVLFSLRSFSVGTDVENYMRIYQEQTLPTVKHFGNIFPDISILFSDYLYFVYSGLLISLGFSKRGFIIITALCMLLPEYIFLRKYSKHPLVTVMTYITIGQMTMMMSAFRQGIAVALSIFAIDYLVQKKMIKYFVIVFVAAGFHATAYILIPVYFLTYLFKDTKASHVVLLFSLSGLLGGKMLIEILSALNMGARFGPYLDGRGFGTNPLVVLMYLMIALIYIVFRRNNIRYKKKEKSVDKIIFLWFSIGLGILFLSLQLTIISRLSYYFFVGVPLILDRIIDMQHDFKTRKIVILSCLLIEVLYFYYTTPISVFGISNYTFYWS